MKSIVPPELEKGRVLIGRFASKPEWGFNGAFRLLRQKVWFYLVISCGGGWEHVSVEVHERGKPKRTPTWEEMCFVKNLVWGNDEYVVQFHPPKAKNVDIAPHVLHLWRPTESVLPVPPLVFV